MTAPIMALAALTVFVASGARWLGNMRRVTIPDRRWPFLLAWGAAAVLGVASFTEPGAGWVSAVPAVLAAVGGAGMLSLYALGVQRAASPIGVGEHIPVFTALDEQRRRFESPSLDGTLVLIKFFRGHW